MGEVEVSNACRLGGELHTRPDQPNQEIWLITSIKHSRQFENKIVGDHLSDVCMAFTVDVNEFGKQCAGEDIIHQLGSRSKKKGQADMKNLVKDGGCP